MNEKLHLFGKDPAVLQKSCRVSSIYFVNKLYLNPKCRSYLKINVPIFLMKTNILLYTLHVTFINFSNKIFVINVLTYNIVII